MKLNLLSLSTAILLSTVITACGGGSNESAGTTPPAITNSTPIANAGVDQSVAITEQISLDASASSDADSDTLTYVWSIPSAPEGSAATLSALDIASPNITPDIEGEYTFDLVVNDGTVSSTVDQITVTVFIANILPIANAGNDQAVNTGSEVELDASASTDSDEDPLTYSWVLSSIPESSNATLNASDSVSPKFTADIDGSYVAQLTVNDGKEDSDITTVTITAITPTLTFSIANLTAELGCSIFHANKLNGFQFSIDGDVLGTYVSGTRAEVTLPYGEYILDVILNKGSASEVIVPSDIMIVSKDNVALLDENGVPKSDEITFPNSSQEILYVACATLSDNEVALANFDVEELPTDSIIDLDNDSITNDDDEDDDGDNVSDVNDYQPYNAAASGVAVYYVNATGSSGCPAAALIEIYATVNGVSLGNLAVETYKLIELDATENTEIIFYNATDDGELFRSNENINSNGFRVGISCDAALVDYSNLTFIE
jgi:hypothetical protein